MRRSDSVGKHVDSLAPPTTADFEALLQEIDFDKLPAGMDFQSFFEEVLEAASGPSYDELMSMSPRFFAGESLRRLAFERRLRARWYRAIYLYDLFLITAREYGAQFNERHRQEAVEANDFVFEALTRIHGRACLISSEIRALMVAGFASGSLARWRSLHELAVVSLFIKEHGQDVAERYLLHEVVVSAKAAATYQEHHEALGEPSLTPEEINDAQEAIRLLVARFGKEYAGDWGWAAGVIPGRPKFEQIENAVGFAHMRPRFRMASHSVHAGYKGMTFDIGLSGARQLGVIQAGPTNSGFADPGYSAVLSLNLCTVALLNLIPAPDTIVGLKVLLRLSDAVGDAFLTAHRKLERDEARFSDMEDSIYDPASTGGNEQTD